VEGIGEGWVGGGGQRDHLTLGRCVLFHPLGAPHVHQALHLLQHARYACDERGWVIGKFGLGDRQISRGWVIAKFHGVG
jgi:hypothetical protein